MPDDPGHTHDHDAPADARPDVGLDASGNGNGAIALEDPTSLTAERRVGPVAPPPAPPDPAQQSLADALQFSFLALKAIMVIGVIGYLASGYFSVAADEVAIRLRFGKIVGEDRIYTEGWHFGLPRPIEDRVKVKIDSRTVVVNDAFWYELAEGQAALTRAERAQQLRRPLNPEQDGSLVTGDANIVHGRFTAAYRVPGDDAQAVIDYVHHVGDPERAAELVRAAVEQGAVFAAAQSTAEDFINNAERVRVVAKARAQAVLDALETGLRIDTLSATTDMPNAVIQEFNAVSQAESERGKLIDEARQAATQTLGATAGEAADGLFDLVRAYELARSAEDAFLAPRLDGVLSHSLDGLLLPDDVAPLLERVEAYRAARAAGDDARAETLAAEIDAAVDAITTADPRRVMSRLLERFAVAIQAEREEEAERVFAAMNDVADRHGDLPEIAAVAEELDALGQVPIMDDDGFAQALLAEAEALTAAASAEGEAIGGEVAQSIFQAQGYRTRIVNEVRGEAERFDRLLAEYRRNPRIVASRLWQTARERIFTSPDIETIYTLPGDLRLDINRDPELQRQREERALRGEDE